ncbi:cysteine desulfurase [Spiroplasma corruscae]|uniref:Cysteine desulfurase n=1 Tax=Spiroplasma corruscae TaxID=216934 RepID=A0A222ENB7_9MOLU|nr:aminotransferase class V-fold PLP-dependent enzyme [Spiroplasma corruscae]ASP27986.1 cysteine desulfurase [Spiroplasma corruscae]
MNYKNLFSYFKNNVEEIYFDSAATSIKFDEVIKAQSEYDLIYAANAHNNLFKNAFLSNQMIIDTRIKIKNFINATDEKEVIFTSGTTYSLNQLAFGLKPYIKENDEILLTELEHSSNLLPWMVVAKEKKAQIKYLALNNDYSIDETNLINQLNKNVKVISFAVNSNTLAIKNNVERIVEVVKTYNKNILVILDLAQSIIHCKTDVANWNVDAIAFSTHKMFGPFGLGVLWAKKDLLNSIEPLLYGGGNNIDIKKNDYKLAQIPEKFESGTLNLSAIYAFNKCLDIINEIGLDNLIEYPKTLKDYFRNNINDIIKSKFKFYNLENEEPIILFNLINVNSQDFGAFLNKKYNISVRVGKHCARLTTNVIGAHSTIRISLSIYNTKEDIDILIKALLDYDSWIEEMI